jgi:hypothetical protein
MTLALVYSNYWGLAHLKASLLRARKTVNDISHPMVRPTIWHVEAYERFSRDNSVSDHPVYLSVETTKPGRVLTVYRDVLHGRNDDERCENHGQHVDMVIGL